MNFNDHSSVKGAHAFLSASKYHWINYDVEKLKTTYERYLAVEKGTKLHALACDLITMGVKLPKTNKTLNLYVNDAIGYKMTPEQPLYYSDNCFGTADAISFNRGMLRIHDLKTGETKASMTQLEIYAALFCLEYEKNPRDIDMELRIYQSDKVLVHNPNASDILIITDKIITFDRELNKLK